jgi:hypothetical protein
MRVLRTLKLDNLAPASRRFARICRLTTETITSRLEQEQLLIASTQNWFHRVVIAEKLCPFAPPFQKDPELMRVVAPTLLSLDEAVEAVASEVEALVGRCSSQSAHETTLIVLDSAELDTFQEFVRFSWRLYEEAVGMQFQETIQLVQFHPQATHQTYGENDNDDAASYTIRSPYPTVHLLREKDVMRAVTSGYQNLEQLPSRNKAKFVAQGVDVCRQRLDSCYARDECES